MEEKEYQSELNKIEAQKDAALKALHIKYATSNNPHKVGDIIEDHIRRIQIKEIKVYVGMGLPQCIYYGIELKKDGTQMKKQSGRPVYQSNVSLRDKDLLV